ncbi:LysR substrate-binding domain-containing protein [Mesorhizobium silamurunense]|uniref:LysR substrate-binding domain-containing protein n=1 Tax=Mesorhizobium silamurunense TaxID=499528 RepID=UPI00177E360B|nr:LysR substrate-binding domain-containing protein [Mesorhizobium silamurunense]
MKRNQRPETRADPNLQRMNSAARIPPLNMLRAFDAVSRLGTMRAAAIDLGINHTVVSRHVANLEAWLGVKLVDTGPRGVKLTNEGDLYSHRINTAFALIGDATADLRPQLQGRVLRIWCVSGLATYWVASRLGVLQAMFPGVEILLRPFERAPGFDEINADVMIGYCRAEQFPANATVLATPRMFPVANRDWIRSHSSVTSLQALAGEPLIHEVSRHQWTDWFELAGISLSAPLTGPLLWDAALGIDAAVNGQGVALASQLTARQFLESGALIELFRSDVRLGSYYLVAAPRQARSANIRHLTAWLTNELAVGD